MKPKTKQQKRVAELSKRLAPLTQKKEEWIFSNFSKIARRLKSGNISCLECGHTWKSEDSELADSVLGCNCPECNAKLTTQNTQKQRFVENDYFAVITTKNEYQVVRYIYAEKDMKNGRPAVCFCREVIQYWIEPDGKCTIMAMLRGMNFYLDVWNWSSELEIRKENAAYHISPAATHPNQRIIPKLKRNGYTGNNNGMSYKTLFPALLSDSKIETLWKAGQYVMVRRFVSDNRELTKLWNSVKICIRNNYYIEDATMWQDYIDLLKYFKKDALNAKYVCPENLKKAHDRLVEKKAEILRKKEIERRMAEIEAETQTFEAMKKKYFGVRFSDGLIDVVVLDSLQEYIREGEALKHCVFTNDYHLKDNSLILSARIKNTPIETVELSLKDYSILQCRGKHNQSTEYHERIIGLVRQNVNQIKKRKRSKIAI